MSPPDSNYPLSEIPSGARKGLFSTSIMLFSFIFFTATMFAGGKINMAFDFSTRIWAAIIDNGLIIVEVLVLQGLTIAAMVIYPARLCGWQ